ncbi:MAG: hypothetical protein ACXVH1_29340, partial [Solirubrobacteraceae bacterium]
RAAAVLTFVVAGLFDLLFFVLNELPATVPVAVTLLLVEGWRWRERRRGQTGVGAGVPSWRGTGAKATAASKGV